MRNDHLGELKPRRTGFRIPSLGYYLIITDAKETEKNYFNGLRDCLPPDIKDQISIKIINTKTEDLLSKAIEFQARSPRYQKTWIVFDRDRVNSFDNIIEGAKRHFISAGWSNPCFEIWLHAYLGEMPVFQESVECCRSFGASFYKVAKKKYFKNSKTLYEDIVKLGDEDKALAIARNRHLSSQDNYVLPSKMLSTTTVYRLVSEIRQKAIF